MIFVGLSSRSSGQIRGIQVASALRACGKKAEFLESENRDVIKNKDETIVFVRSINRDHAKHLKSLGCRIVFDILDRPVADIHECLKSGNVFSWEKYNIPEIDEFIVNNSLIKKHLETTTGKTCTVIPHHSVDRSEIIRKNVKIAGYVGLEDQISNKGQIEEICQKFGIKFISENPVTRDSCIKCLQNIDLGIINLELNNARTDSVLQYKPNTKLTNFQAFGIPTISVPYQSFVEFGGTGWISSDNLLEDLESFLSSRDLSARIQEMSETSIIDSKRCSLDSIARLYLDLDKKWRQ